MKHRLLPTWVVLWTQLGIRPTDLEHMTLDDVLAVEIFTEEAQRAQRRAQARQQRRR